MASSSELKRTVSGPITRSHSKRIDRGRSPPRRSISTGTIKQRDASPHAKVEVEETKTDNRANEVTNTHSLTRSFTHSLMWVD